MTAADSAPKKTEVVPFARLTRGALGRVLEAQRREWRERLAWDIAEIADFVEGAIDSRSLRGLALVADDEVVGFGFYTVEVERCLIGELYVRPEARSPEMSALLADGLVRRIRRAKPRMRVESQSIVFDGRGLDEAFAKLGFARHERAYLALDLDAREFDEPPEHRRVVVRAWEPSDFAPAVEVVYQGYRGSVDAKLNAQYRSREGCADLIDALTDTAWCGRFDPRLARVAVDRETGRCCGVAIASAISSPAAHFGQVSVLPRRQNEGVGRAMLESALAAARREGFATATLAVTRANVAAGALYHSLGFRSRVEFPVYTRDAAPGVKASF
jgi:ribosomal protein S18 acetylase RimI-like enzyme